MSHFKIFPATIINNQKVPLIRGWYENATNDPNQIELWKKQFGERLKFFGIPTGEINGIFALDIDTKKVNGFETIKKSGNVLPYTLFQNTPSGGAHLIFKAQPGRHYPNTVNQTNGLDTRGDRGWIAFYGFGNQLEPAEAPDWVFELIKKGDKKNETVVAAPIGIAPQIAQEILESILDNIRNAPAGESNNVLNIEAYRAGQLISTGAITREDAEKVLFQAAKERGKPDYEAKATIESGINGGLKNPLTSPFGSAPPTPMIDLPPPPPGIPERWTPNLALREDFFNVKNLKKPQLFKDWSVEDIQITTADGGTGKTTAKLFEAICLALGERFLGFECKQQGKTLFITGEDTEKKLLAVMGAIMRQMGLFDGSPQNEQKIETIRTSIVIKKDADLCLISKNPQGFLVPNPDAMRKVMEAVEDFKPKMIVFDPISSFWGSESALNDMNKAVTRFMSDLVEKAYCCVEMINHMGKSSSANKDMSQFAGRGGSGLPSNSRVARVLHSLTSEEYRDHTGKDLAGETTAALCVVNKFSDGSSLLGKPFIILRNGYIFSREMLSPVKEKELENQMSDNERIFKFIQEERKRGAYPTKKVIVGYFMTANDHIPKARSERALVSLLYHGYLNKKLQEIDNPDQSQSDKVLVIIDQETGKEI